MCRNARIPLAAAMAVLLVWVAGAAVSPDAVSSRAATVDGRPAGEVLIGEQSVMLLRTATADLSPKDRADIIANRLRAALGETTDPSRVYTAQLVIGESAYDAVYVGDRVITAVTKTEADAHGATTRALATLWRDNIARALGEEQPPSPPPAEQTTDGTQPSSQPAKAAVDWTGTAQKWVPIFSLETSRAAIGAAQVAGPTAQVNKTKAVMQLRLDFKGFGRIYAYVPVSHISTKLDRVQGVSVWAVGDVRLVKF